MSQNIYVFHNINIVYDSDNGRVYSEGSCFVAWPPHLGSNLAKVKYTMDKIKYKTKKELWSETKVQKLVIEW